jgi:hypothetical protein
VAPHPAHLPDEVEDLNAVGGHCPRCGTDYRPGFHMCADCGVPLLPGPAPDAGHPDPEKVDAWAEANARVWSEPHKEHTSKDFAEIASVCRLPWEEAWLMVGRLRSEGIPALVYPQDFSPFAKWHTKIFDVVVAKDRLEDARWVIRDLALGAAPP